ncbi:uncharacterized protein SAPINGB_P000495 [Magnusiomyces paraingens]|uniref:Hyphally-regulated cell wall protein N-terminal domain-containing protein n=1 Tax=Magnusiomyces paraingens TaxID=2606893 RepID=A0A5E8B156_9ASCO|nr:uncharacterized protein SAPINGB_P000495 [Saprochaete ingens]VVT44675.1 unnamed protein product [Saprochaete ingens]
MRFSTITFSIFSIFATYAIAAPLTDAFANADANAEPGWGKKKSKKLLFGLTCSDEDWYSGDYGYGGYGGFGGFGGTGGVGGSGGAGGAGGAGGSGGSGSGTSSENTNNNNAGNTNSNGNNNNNRNTNQIVIYVVPGGYLSPNAQVSGSVPFTGTVINGVLYGNSPSGGSFGNVVVNNQGQLQVVPGSSATGTTTPNWVVQNGTIVPNDQQVISCIDANGNTVLFCDTACPSGEPAKKVNLSADHSLSPI